MALPSCFCEDEKNKKIQFDLKHSRPWILGITMDCKMNAKIFKDQDEEEKGIKRDMTMLRKENSNNK